MVLAVVFTRFNLLVDHDAMMQARKHICHAQSSPVLAVQKHSLRGCALRTEPSSQAQEHRSEAPVTVCKMKTRKVRRDWFSSFATESANSGSATTIVVCGNSMCAAEKVCEMKLAM